MTKMVKKGDLPQKVCETCKKPYAWRKKWARTWDTIRYCSKRCKSEAKTTSAVELSEIDVRLWKRK